MFNEEQRTQLTDHLMAVFHKPFNDWYAWDTPTTHTFCTETEDGYIDMKDTTLDDEFLMLICWDGISG